MSEAVRSFRLGDRAKVHRHEQVEVRVPTARAAGYVWSVDLPAGVRQIDRTEAPARGFGGQVEAVYRLACERPGIFRITFTQGRPWENTGVPEVLVLECDR